MDDLVLDREYKRGDEGPKVRLIQEGLGLEGFQGVVDGGFGPATEVAVRQFQVQAAVAVDGIVGPVTFSRLVLPMTQALAPIASGGATLGAMVVSYAKQHFAQRPREVGGQNRGPWVRLYMSGHDGPDWPWCAGFASFILSQACTTVNTPVPIAPSVSCDSLAASAKQNGRFVAEADPTGRARLTPGSLFLNRRTATDWVHTGVVLDAQAEVFQTIEGNTNDDGSREGYEVCQRVRGYAGKDFVLI